MRNMRLKYFLVRYRDDFGNASLSLDSAIDTPHILAAVENMSCFVRWLTNEDLRNLRFIYYADGIEELVFSETVNWGRDGF